MAIPSSADVVGTGTFSISVWIKTTSASGVIIQQRDPNNFNGEYQVALSGGKVTFFVYGNNEYEFQMVSNATVDDGNWHNIVVVRESNGTGEIFIDGKADSTATGPDVTLGSGFNVYLGADERNLAYGINGDYFSGLIENVAIFNTALTSSSVQAIDQGTITSQSTDQRGDPRIVNGAIDIGAVEEQPYEVTNTNDSGPGSLRQEVADDGAGDQPVIFAPGLDGQTITLTSGPIPIKNSLVIEGPGSNDLTISGGGSSQILVVDSGNVSISGLTFTDGLGSQGGAIANSGNLDDLRLRVQQQRRPGQPVTRSRPRQCRRGDRQPQRRDPGRHRHYVLRQRGDRCGQFGQQRRCLRRRDRECRRRDF